jgi:hypothetical protein
MNYFRLAVGDENRWVNVIKVLPVCDLKHLEDALRGLHFCP